MTLLRRARAAPGPDGHLVGITPAEAAWQLVHFDAYQLPPEARLRGETGRNETALVILGGVCTVRAGSDLYASIGRRRDVWEKTPPYLVLLPPGIGFEVRAHTGVHLAAAGAPANPAGSPRLITPEAIAVEHRGEGQTYRYVQHLLPPTVGAARLILVEVYTPAGNWSSFPPHKHDTE